jgi:hypothetical protein
MHCFIIFIPLIPSVFPQDMQGLVRGIFNTITNIGKSLGLAVVASIANTISAR